MRVLLALIVFACCTGDARAATVSIARHMYEADNYGDPSYAQLIVAAAPGEANDLVLSTHNGIVVRDGGAPLEAGAGCQGAGRRERDLQQP